MNCPHCETPAATNQRFCRSCGINLAEATAAAPPPAPTPGTTQAPEAVQPEGAAVPSPPASPATTPRCDRCGGAVDPHQRFCRTCGAAQPADDAPTIAQPAAPAPAAPHPANRVPRPPAPTTRYRPAAPAPPSAAPVAATGPGTSSRRAVLLGLGVAVLLVGAVGAAAVIVRPWESEGHAPATAAGPRTTANASHGAPLPADAGNTPPATTTVATTAGTADAPADDRITVIPENANGKPATDGATSSPESSRSRQTAARADTAPVAAFRRYLTALAQHDYDETWTYFSSPPGGSGRQAWIDAQKQYDARIATGDLRELSRDGGTARVRVSFYTHDRGDAANGTPVGICNWFHGTVYLVRRHGRWLYEPARPRQRTKLTVDHLPSGDHRCSPLLD